MTLHGPLDETVVEIRPRTASTLKRSATVVLLLTLAGLELAAGSEHIFVVLWTGLLMLGATMAVQLVLFAAANVVRDLAAQTWDADMSAQT